MVLWNERTDFIKNPKYSLQPVFTMFWISSVLFALCLFLFGFFPMKTGTDEFATEKHIPSKLLNYSLDPDILYRKRVGRLVFVLIDAFRWDFLNTPKNMPYISELQRSRLAAVLTARCHPPTATMPRVKALMTGSIPNYIDVILNLGTNQVKEDNLMHQAVESGLKVVFYGDEVWLDLFPKTFLRKEGTTSFFVTDYTEVDSNVTRNIAREMGKTDWDILILHYLGLDHIGHLAGPSSPLVPLKLEEMDAVIKNLHHSLQQWDLEHPQEPSLLVVVGDHGMHDSGSHGGATMGETLVSLIIIENVGRVSFPGRPEVSQIDIAVTLATLLGLPIPKSSLGVLIPYALGRLTHEQYLFALMYNAQQVADQFLQSHPNGQSEDSFTMFLEAHNVHLSWLDSKSEVLRRQAETMYFAATREMSSYIVKNLVTFDLWALIISLIILVQVFLCVLTAKTEAINKYFWKKARKILLVFFGGSAVFSMFIFYSTFCNTLLSSSERYICILVYAIFIAAILCWNLFALPFYLQKIKYRNFSCASAFLCIGSVLHSLSLSSSSLIEEEHQTWYFLWTTLMLLILITISVDKTTFPSLVFLVLSILFSHRILRKLNQTGDKWASVPDIADWMEQPSHWVFLSSLFLTGLLGVWMSLYKLKCITDTVDKILYSLALICVLLYRCSIGDILPEFEISRGVQQVQFFWLICGTIFMRSLWRLRHTLSFKEIIKILMTVWVLLSSLLLQPVNVVLIPYSVISSFTLQSSLKQPFICSIAHIWLGKVVFFYQGNSNSLSTINVATGYIGVEQHSMVLAGLLVFVHTYSFPVLATFLFWQAIMSQPDTFQRKENMITSLHTEFLQRLLPLSVFIIVIFCQRNHLFIWSVFAPKLLYEAVHSAVVLLLVMLGHLLILIFCDI